MSVMEQFLTKGEKNGNILGKIQNVPIIFPSVLRGNVHNDCGGI